MVVASRERPELVVLDPLGPTPTEPLGRVTLPAVPRALDAGELHFGSGEAGNAPPPNGPDRQAHRRSVVVLATDGRRLVVTAGPEVLAETRLGSDLPRCVHVLADGHGVIVGFQSTRSLTLHPFAGGVFAESTHSHPLGGIPRSLTEADLDGDGEAELVVVGGDRSVWVFGFGAPGGSAGWFPPDGPEVLEWPSAPIPIDVEAADGDGDGADELFLLHAAALTYARWADFTPAGPRVTSSAYAGQTPLDLAVAHLDRDGALDAVVANRDSLAISLVRGRDASTLVADARVPVGGFPTAIAAGDLNGDGRGDLMVANSKDDDLSVLLAADGGLGGRLVPAGRVPVGPAPHALDCSDLDGDGWLDVILLSVDGRGGRVVRRYGDGTGRLAARPDRPDRRLGPGASALLRCDLDGDGEVELVVVDAGSDELWVFTGGGGGALEERSRTPLASGPTALAVIELDGDRAPELAVALGGPGERLGVALLEFRPDGAGGLVRVDLGHLATHSAPFDLAASDLDGDGREDLAVLANTAPGENQGRLQLFLQAGPGRFVPWKNSPTSLTPRDLLVTDRPGDGGAEILVCAQYAHVVDLWTVRSGAPGLERLDGLGVGVGCMAAVPFDLDGDGVGELAVANGHSDDVSVVTRRR